jgi:hypothetical protein
VAFTASEDVVGMEMRDQDGVDLGGIDTGRLHVAGQADGGWLPLAGAGSRIDHDELVADLEDDDGQRDWHVIAAHAGLGERRLGLLDAGILDECRIVRLLPDAIVERGDLNRADLVSVKPLARSGGRLGPRRAEDGKVPVETEGGGQSRCGYDAAA